MSVYRKIRNGVQDEAYSYEFRLGGKRFAGPTHETQERKAKAVERLKKDEASTLLKNQPRDARWTFHRAMRAYIDERLNGELDYVTKPIMVWLEDNIDRHELLSAITTAFIARLTAKRSKDHGVTKGTKVSNATINRTVTEPMRRIIRYVEQVHDQRAGKILWKEVMRKEPNIRERELRNNEERDLFADLRDDYKPIIRFAIVSGMRLHELVELTWDNVDFSNSRIWVLGKGDKLASIPMAPVMRSILEGLVGHHATCVFTYVAERTTINPKTGDRLKEGFRYPITYYGLKSIWGRARKAAGLKDFRFHDLRHTAGSRIARASKDLKVVQTVLRHDDIASTMRYTHVLDEDVMNGIQAGAEISVVDLVAPTTTKTTTQVAKRSKKAMK